MNERGIRGVIPVDERDRGSQGFATLRGLALKTTLQSQTLSIKDVAATGSQGPLNTN